MYSLSTHPLLVLCPKACNAFPLGEQVQGSGVVNVVGIIVDVELFCVASVWRVLDETEVVEDGLVVIVAVIEGTIVMDLVVLAVFMVVFIGVVVVGVAVVKVVAESPVS